MNCPYCGREMENGYITSDAKTIAWRAQRHDSALVGKGGGVQLARNLFGGAATIANAHHCASCQKIVLDYDASSQ